MVVKSLAKWRSPNKTKWNVRKSFKIKWHNRWLALSCFEQLIFSQNLTIPYACDEYFHFLLVTNSYYYSHIYSISLVKNLIQTVNAYTYGALGLSTGSMDRSLLHKRRYKRYERLRKVREIRHLLGPFSHNPITPLPRVTREQTPAFTRDQTETRKIRTWIGRLVFADCTIPSSY